MSDQEIRQLVKDHLARARSRLGQAHGSHTEAREDTSQPGHYGRSKALLAVARAKGAVRALERLVADLGGWL